MMTNEALDKQIEDALNRSESAIADDGFSEVVMSSLPRKRIRRSNSRRWRLAAAAAVGSALTNLFIAPTETVFGLYSISTGDQTTIAASALFVTIVALPLAWLLKPE